MASTSASICCSPSHSLAMLEGALFRAAKASPPCHIIIPLDALKFPFYFFARPQIFCLLFGIISPNRYQKSYHIDFAFSFLQDNASLAPWHCHAAIASSGPRRKWSRQKARQANTRWWLPKEHIFRHMLLLLPKNAKGAHRNVPSLVVGEAAVSLAFHYLRRLFQECRYHFLILSHYILQALGFEQGVVWPCRWY